MQDVEERERLFWNTYGRDDGSVAGEAVVRVHPSDRYDHSMPWLPYLGLPSFNQCILDIVGDVRGKRVLDLGTGTGFLAVLLALHGARVVGVDVAEGQLEVASRRAMRSGVRQAVSFLQMTGESLNFRDDAFDAVVGSFVLHHVDLEACSREIYRVLTPAGKAVFIETSARNKLLMLCRSHLLGRLGIPKHGSPDEHPLTREDERCLAEVFRGRVRWHYPETIFLRMAAAYIGALRHWPVMGALRRMDLALCLCPPFRRLSYFTIVECAKSM
jgi:2-polyprenyl-3-methyl-5-hydroxy-6-metoxy-1,4-benzoquinol methylase